MPARRLSGRGVPEHPRNLERQTQNSGQAANCRVFCHAETDFRPAIGCLPRVIPRFPSFPDFPLCSRIEMLIRHKLETGDYVLTVTVNGVGSLGAELLPVRP